MLRVKKMVFVCIFVISFSFLAGCSNKSLSHHKIITIKQGEDIVISKNDITSLATFYNYEYDDYNIQLFAVKGTDDKVRVVFNTCSSCNPSPESYFVPNGDYYECQNCKNKFHRDDIGLTKSYGCSPIAVLDENKQIEDDNIIVSSSFIESYKNKFKSINIYKN